MKATSLSINLCGPCNAKCPFCISKMTWKTGARDNEKLIEALPKAFGYAKYHGVDTVLVTGSGEPMITKYSAESIAAIARDDYAIPIRELQTNGYRLWEYKDSLSDSFPGLSAFTHISISAASPSPEISAKIMGLPEDYNYLRLARALSELGFIVRIQLNLNHEGFKNNGMMPYGWRIESFCAILSREYGVHQLSLHQIQKPWGPIKSGGRKYAEWIDKYAWTTEECEALWNQVAKQGTFLRTLSFGAKVYDVNGVSVAVTHCMDMEAAQNDQVRSLILQPDGHIYHHWNYRGSILL